MLATDTTMDSQAEVPPKSGSPACLLVGFTRSLAGWMAYEDGHIAFADEDGDVIFNAEISDITDLKSPWYYFGGGLKMKVLDQKYRISFVQPNDGSEISARPAGWRSDAQNGMAVSALVGQKIRDISTGRKNTAIWKVILSQGQGDA